MNYLLLSLVFFISLIGQKRYELNLSFKNQFITNQLNNEQHLNTIFDIRYKKNIWYFGLNYRTNSDLRFQILPEPIELTSPDITNIINLDDVSFNPDRYVISNEVSFQTGLQFEGVAFNFSGYRIREINNLESIEISGNTLFVRSSNTENNRFFADLNLRLNTANIDFMTGLKQLKLSGSIDEEMRYQLDFKSYPFIGLSYHNLNYHFETIYDEFSWEISAGKRLEDIPLEFSTTIMMGQKSDLSMFSVSLNYYLVTALNLNFAFQRRDNKIDQFKRETFIKQVNGRYINNLINDSKFSLGLSYNYETGLISDQLTVSVNIKNEPIYLAKQLRYQHEAIGEVYLMNKGEKRHRFYIELKSDDNFIKYKSEYLNLEANDTLNLPLYIFMNTADLEERSVQKQIEVHLVNETGSELLYRKTIQLFDRNYWSGEPSDLLNFLQSDNHLVRQYAAQTYRNTSDPDSNFYKQQFSKLVQFINLIAKDKQYVTDPVPSILLDEVQYPNELLKNKIGDCEDLLVFYMSALMSIGHQCAIISLLPKDNQPVGHVFLLLDTRIPVSRQEDLNLSDIGTVKRQNYLGEYTLWLPIEVTVLDKGFDIAYKAGLRQYYDELIVKEGIQNHTVEVIDTY